MREHVQHVVICMVILYNDTGLHHYTVIHAHDVAFLCYVITTTVTAARDNIKQLIIIIIINRTGSIYTQTVVQEALYTNIHIHYYS